jgi:repressor LexA
MIDGEATVKTLALADKHVWLMPHNVLYPPIPGDDAIIIGKVISVLRNVERRSGPAGLGPSGRPRKSGA